MFKNVRIFAALSVLMVAAFILGACTTPTPEVIEKIVTQEVTVVETQIVEKEVEKIVEVEVTPEPVKRTGGWLDTIVMTSIDSANSAIAQIQSDDLDVYAYTVSDAEALATVQGDPNLTFLNSVGSYDEYTFNTAKFTDEAQLNPFSNPKVREAINWLIDRNFLVQEVYAGALAVPKYLPINSSFSDYARYVDAFRAIEAEYAYNPEKAKAQIDAAMTEMGAVLGADGKWAFNDAPITVIFLIRSEDERSQLGNYLADKLEEIGFTVDRQIKTRTELSPLWVQSNPADGLWHIYTGGWITTAVSRDDGSNFSFFYGPYDYPIPLHQQYVNTPEFDEMFLKLRNNDFKTLEEREQLFRDILPLAMQDSARVWIVDELAFTPYNKDVVVAADLAGQIAGAQLWGYTIRWAGQEGGTMRIAQPGILVEPWNPIAGSNWIYDSMPIRATNDYGFVYNPYTGLAMPKRAEKAEVVVEEGLPVGASSDWVTLSFAPSIEVPGDAWVDWDAVNQKFITASEKFTTTQTAVSKTTVYYPADLFDTITWHDGSPLTVADFVMGMIMTFDPGKPESAIFDEAQASSLEAFMAHFKGVKVLSTDPLVIETYDDTWYLDAENMAYGSSWYPLYGYGQGAWHNLALGVRAEASNQLAFSADKADANSVEWMSYIAGPSLAILKTEMVSATAEAYVPFAPTLGEYLGAEEIALRYENLATWYRDQGHFWLGNGPYFLNKAFPVEQSLTLSRYEAYPDLADKWSIFGGAKLATTEVDGPGQVKIGDAATFDIFVTFKDEVYPAAELESAKYLLYDAKGVMVSTGPAELAGDGQFTLTLPADVTSKLEAGSNKLEVAVISKIVSIPSFATFEFVTAP